MAHWFEVWARPGDPNFGRVLDDPASRVGTLHDGVNLLGDGSMAMPSSLPQSVFDSILKVDPVTPANSVSSLVRVFSETDPTTPVFEWIPRAIVPPQNKEDPDVNVSGWSIKSVLDYARTEAYDWDGSLDFAPAQPDWDWGANNLLGNPGFEESSITPTQWTLIITATGGTYTLTDGTDTTLAINFNDGAAAIEARLQTDIAAITDIIVVQAGNSPRTFIIEGVDPALGFTLAINPGSLTGGTGTIDQTQDGERSPSPWARAATLVAGAPKGLGSYTVFEVSSAQAHTGSFSLAIDATPSTATSNRNPGAQQVVTTTPGALYQASIWIYPTSATDRFRLGIFGVGEEFIAWNSSAGVTLTANTWNQVTVTDILLPDDATQVIFRVACTNIGPSNPSLFYIDDGEFYKGLPPDSIGGILTALYDSYVNPVIQGTIYWDDGSGTDTPYLTLDFTDAVDSAGVAWNTADHHLRVYQRQTFLQVLEQAGAAWNYEFRVVPDDVELGTWLLQVYNPGGMMVDYQTAQTPAIQGGQGDTQRGIRRFLPATDFMVEGLGRVTGRAQDANLMAALGKIGAQRIGRELPDLVSVAAAAQEDAADAVASGLTYPYVITIPQDTPPGADIPLDAYVLGDALTIHDPPEVDDVGRLWDVVATFSAEQTEWEVQFLPLSVSGGSP